MEPGLRISVVDPDEDYLGIEVAAASSRFAGTTRIYVGLDELSILSSRIEGLRQPLRINESTSSAALTPELRPIRMLALSLC